MIAVVRRINRGAAVVGPADESLALLGGTRQGELRAAGIGPATVRAVQGDAFAGCHGNHTAPNSLVGHVSHHGIGVSARVFGRVGRVAVCPSGQGIGLPVGRLGDRRGGRQRGCTVQRHDYVGGCPGPAIQVEADRAAPLGRQGLVPGDGIGARSDQIGLPCREPAHEGLVLIGGRGQGDALIFLSLDHNGIGGVVDLAAVGIQGNRTLPDCVQRHVSGNGILLPGGIVEGAAILPALQGEGGFADSRSRQQIHIGAAGIGAGRVGGRGIIRKRAALQVVSDLATPLGRQSLVAGHIILGAGVIGRVAVAPAHQRVTGLADV